jgi:hypothetical protein
MIALKSWTLHYVINMWCPLDSKCHFLKPNKVFFFNQVVYSIHFYSKYSNLCLSDIMPIMLIVPCLICILIRTLNYKGTFFFLMFMYMCTCVNLPTSRPLLRTNSLFSFSLFFCKNKSDDGVDERSTLSNIYIYVQNHYIKRKKKTLVAGGINRQKRVFAFSFFSYKTYAINGILHWYY